MNDKILLKIMGRCSKQHVQYLRCAVLTHLFTPEEVGRVEYLCVQVYVVADHEHIAYSIYKHIVSCMAMYAMLYIYAVINDYKH